VDFSGDGSASSPEAWANLAADWCPRAGVVVAVLDTGVAYANRGPSAITPASFFPDTFVKGMTFVDRSPYQTTATATARSSRRRSPRRPTTITD